jgi:DnaJ-class molecular chaperone
MKWKNIDNSYTNQIDKIKDQTPYERLGVDRSTSLNDVKKAYRRKVSLYHPDRTDSFMTGYSEEVVKLLNQAVEHIKKDKKL